eukprot:Pgem_evm8s14806
MKVQLLPSQNSSSSSLIPLLPSLSEVASLSEARTSLSEYNPRNIKNDNYKYDNLTLCAKSKKCACNNSEDSPIRKDELSFTTTQDKCMYVDPVTMKTYNLCELSCEGLKKMARQYSQNPDNKLLLYALQKANYIKQCESFSEDPSNKIKLLLKEQLTK